MWMGECSRVGWGEVDDMRVQGGGGVGRVVVISGGRKTC